MVHSFRVGRLSFFRRLDHPVQLLPKVLGVVAGSMKADVSPGVDDVELRDGCPERLRRHYATALSIAEFRDQPPRNKGEIDCCRPMVHSFRVGRLSFFRRLDHPVQLLPKVLGVVAGSMKADVSPGVDDVELRDGCPERLRRHYATRPRRTSSRTTARARPGLPTPTVRRRLGPLANSRAWHGPQA